MRFFSFPLANNTDQNLRDKWLARGIAQKEIVLHSCKAALDNEIGLFEAAKRILGSDPGSQASFDFVYPEASVLRSLVDDVEENSKGQEEMEIFYSAETRAALNFLMKEFSTY